ncbi:MAG: membrane protein insertase YidC [Candidatus Muproteobacteria bacterium RBG_16_64_11]|uniref:Membrane protein insertase YidC n=1 Tax=Candidatus Muproteobacteria bacterium RBG_16_64_11 TaxID=1817758 RepID=A0A1F6TAD8_9PROT|nr:MAG: membrane protein insertase YidC [Candidatus Muproteobacteria bacterium RBG_16_64_11]
MDNQRLVLFAALSVIILLLWQAWEQDRQARTPPAPAGTAAQREIPQAPSEQRGAPAKAADTPKAGAETLERGERVQVTTDLLRAEIDTHGGDLRVLSLLSYPLALGEPGKPVRLLNDSLPDLFVAQSGLIGRESVWPNHKTVFRADKTQHRLADNQDTLEAKLEWSGPEGVHVTKTYTFRRGEYFVDVSYTVRNGGKEAREVFLYNQLLRTQIAEQGGIFAAMPSYQGAVIYSPEKKYEKVAFSDMVDKRLQREVRGGWVAMLQHYFVGVWLPPAADNLLFYSDVHNGARYVIGYKSLSPTRIAAGQSATLGARLYAGPKEQKRLEQLPEGVSLTVDYGWLTVISAPLFWVLDFIHRWVGNWGWAIILLTALIKLAFYPLSAASYKSMAHMKKMQPKLQVLKERYKDDKQKLNQAMMEMYKTEKINPLGGCLPILVQIPVFIALYWVLLESVELRQAPWALWIKDLSAPDPYYVLPTLMGATMFAQTWLNPQPLDPIQQKVMLAMPIMFTAFFLFFPAGLVLYWVAQNLFSITQQWWITRSIEGAAKS